MNTLLNLIAWLIVFGLVWTFVLRYLPLPAPVMQVINILFVVIVILMVFNLLGINTGFTLPVFKIR